ncbi:MAG: hypothetical protein AAF525_13945, partial [Pseudomonadota bacterium]
MTRGLRTLLVGSLLTVFAAHPDLAADADISISGQITLPDGLSDRLSDGDRLVIKMYHPDEGIEKDLKYWILKKFTLPQAFSVAPTVNMAGNARWSDYIIEVFTDKDGDVLTITQDE